MADVSPQAMSKEPLDIHLLDGSTVRMTQQVKSLQILRTQNKDMEKKRRAANESDTVARKEEKHARELDASLVDARRALEEYSAKLNESPLGYAAAPPEAAKELHALRASVQVAEAECHAQHQTAAMERGVNLAAEREVAALERLLVKNGEVAAAYETRAQQDSQHRKARAKDINAVELAAARVLEDRHKVRVANYEDTLLEAQALHSRQAEAAVSHHKQAVGRMLASTSKTSQVLGALQQRKDAEHAKRLESVLSLKANSDHAFAQMKLSNERKARRKQALEQAHQQEFKDLESKGENPYKVFRRREVDAAAAKAEKLQRAAVKQKEEELVSRILREDEWAQKRDKEELDHKAHEQKYRDELGRHVLEERNKQYLLAKTTEKVDIIDPTGRAVRMFEPSQVTTIKDNAFGLGVNPRKDASLYADVVKMVASKPQHANLELGEFKRFVPKPLPGMLPAANASATVAAAQGGGGNGGSSTSATATTKAPSSTPLSAQASASAAAAAAEESTAEMARLGAYLELPPPAVTQATLRGASGQGGKGAGASRSSSSSSMPQPGSRGGKDKDGGGGSGAGRNFLEGTKPLSKFELECRSKAQERQRRLLAQGSPQVAAGMVFGGGGRGKSGAENGGSGSGGTVAALMAAVANQESGRTQAAFVPKPSVVDFKDFEVGSTYRRRFTLTNASLTFNSFKVLDLPASVRDFFEVSYSKPGRMSAGTTCVVEIAFRPLLNEDIACTLPLLTETGPCSIPVTCSTRKAAPSVAVDTVAFGEVVMGETKTVKIVVRNRGALPCRYEIVDPTSDEVVGNSSTRKRCRPSKVLSESGGRARRRNSIFQKRQLQAQLQLEAADEDDDEDEEEEEDGDGGGGGPLGRMSSGSNGGFDLELAGMNEGGGGGDGASLSGSSRHSRVSSVASRSSRASGRVHSSGLSRRSSVAFSASRLSETGGEDDDGGNGGGGGSRGGSGGGGVSQAAERLAAKELKKLTRAEAGLLAKAASVGAQALKYPLNKGALQYESFGEVEAYGETHHAVIFSPLEPGYYSERIALRFFPANTSTAATATANTTAPNPPNQKSGGGGAVAGGEGGDNDNEQRGDDNNNNSSNGVGTGTGSMIEMIPLRISGTAELYPIFAVEPVLDLRTVLHGKLYRKKLKLRNRGKIAFKVAAQVPPELQGFLEFSVSMAFVQPNSDFELGVALRPSPALLDACRSVRMPQASSSSSGGGGGSDEGGLQSFVLDEFDVVAVPVRVFVPNQAVPVFFTLRCQLTSGAVELLPERPTVAPPLVLDSPLLLSSPTFDSPSASSVLGGELLLSGGGGGTPAQEYGGGDGMSLGGGGSRTGPQAGVLDFGRCFVTERAVHRLKLRNLSRLSQKFGFVGLPACLEVQPSDGFGVLLPFEERTVDVVFKPDSPIEYGDSSSSSGSGAVAVVAGGAGAAGGEAQQAGAGQGKSGGTGGNGGWFGLTMRTSNGGSYKVACAGVGVEPPLEVNHTVLQLAPCSLGDVVTESLTVRNPSRLHAAQFHFVVPFPEASRLKVMPSVATLKPGQAVRVEVQFTASAPPPSKAERAASVAAKRKARAAAAAAAAAVEAEGGDAEAVEGAAKGKDGGSGKKKLSAADQAAAEEALKRAEEEKALAAHAAEEALAAEEAQELNALTPQDIPESVGSLTVSDHRLTHKKNEQQQQPRSPSSPGFRSGEDGNGGGGGEEPWSVHAMWRVPCFVRLLAPPPSSPSANNNNNNNNNNNSVRRGGGGSIGGDSGSVGGGGSVRSAGGGKEDDESVASMPSLARGGGGGNKRQQQQEYEACGLPLHVVVKTAVVERVLEVDQTFLNFGELAVGETKVLPLRITNHQSDFAGNNDGMPREGGGGYSDDDDGFGDGGGSGGGGGGGGVGEALELKAEGLNPAGAFSLLNALRPVKPNGGTATVLVQFSPNCQGLRQDTLTVHAKALGRTLKVAVRGEGVSPALSIEPSDGRVDLGHCVAMDSTRKTVTLRNDSVFPLTFSLVPLTRPTPNFNNQAPFTLVPAEAEVAPGDALEVCVVFKPDHERTWPFHQALKVHVPNQLKENVLYLSGKAHARQMYVVADDEASDACAQQPEEREDPLLLRPAAKAAILTCHQPPPQSLLAAAAAGGGGGGGGAGGVGVFGFGEQEADVPCIKLTFPRTTEAAGNGTRSVTVGCIAITDDKAFAALAGGGSASAGGAFELEWPSVGGVSFFSASSNKGAVLPGKTFEVTFTFSPPVIEETYGLDVGQWARTEVLVKLSGGFCHAHARQQKPVKVLLEGYIQI